MNSSISSVYWDLLSKLSKDARVYVRKKNIVIEAVDPFKVWDFLEDYCEEVIVYNGWSSGSTYNISLLCVSKNVEIVLRIDSLNRPYYLHPAIALFKEEKFLTV